ncbi:MAG: cytidylate kinase-like family protein [Clostridiales bacterium]|nr:cytidylate kinase-like family protein [Clostridiales bacterium]
MSRLLITIGREYGSGGREIGQKLARRLNIAFYGRDELMDIAKHTTNYEEVQSFYEELPVNSLLYAIAMNNFKNGIGRIPFEQIRALCNDKSCVIVGRCSNYIFRDDPDLISIFVHADKQFRLDRVMQVEGLSKQRANERIEEVDRGRRTFFEYYTKSSWDKADGYHLSLDSGVLGIDETVDEIVSYIERRIRIRESK